MTPALDQHTKYYHKIQKIAIESRFQKLEDLDSSLEPKSK